MEEVGTPGITKLAPALAVCLKDREVPVADHACDDYAFRMDPGARGVAFVVRGKPDLACRTGAVRSSGNARVLLDAGIRLIGPRFSGDAGWPVPDSGEAGKSNSQVEGEADELLEF